MLDSNSLFSITIFFGHIIFSSSIWEDYFLIGLIFIYSKCLISSDFMSVNLWLFLGEFLNNWGGNLIFLLLYQSYLYFWIGLCALFWIWTAFTFVIKFYLTTSILFSNLSFKRRNSMYPSAAIWFCYYLYRLNKTSSLKIFDGRRTFRSFTIDGTYFVRSAGLFLFLYY